ncbi:2-keto-3-deoxygluconate permease [Aerococcaceae bacterium DSM 109653]|uniref:2-keto-3-deoxygluconate permease n=1 Tax=Fundicoccus ignavus TaxID=2664442 RepID=A0A844BZI8_9LACT|nr:2-keto-3-deoxygluconate permease [Fundicoccus ignavus]MRI81866.1 2-keto-3-deoxygluconate permease [Fundicoccus ignavus]
MYNFMRKFPGGLLLVPMLLSALFYTFSPNLFRIGGMTQAMFTTDGLNYVIGLTCFCSGAGLNVHRIGKVLKKQGVLLLTKIIICVIASIIFIQLFGQAGIWGISAVAFIAAICSTNPSLYLALEDEMGTPDDVSAFGLVGLLCVPAYPMLIFGLSQETAIDWMPIISTLVPILLGMLVGNLDENMAKFLAPGVSVLTPFMGWSFGASINLIEAVQSGLQGVIITIMFYVLMVPILLMVETKFVKTDGISSLAISSIAGMSVSVPFIISQTNPAIEPFVASATAQIAFGVVLSSIITPFLAKKLDIHNHLDISETHDF